jgi:hypothetical protein
VSQLTFPNTAGTSPDPAGKNIDTRSSDRIRQVVLLISHICWYPPYYSPLHPTSLSFLSTPLPTLQEHKVKSSLPISPCHDHELTRSAHQQNVKWFRSHNATTQLFRKATPILPTGPRHFRTGRIQHDGLLRYSESTSGAPQHS